MAVELPPVCIGEAGEHLLLPYRLLIILLVLINWRHFTSLTVRIVAWFVGLSMQEKRERLTLKYLRGGPA